MAKKALIEKSKRKPKYKVRAYTRCRKCGRPRSVYRKFGLCRICLRELVHAGEVPGVTKATKSIAGFKLREGQSIGAKVTLRGDRMWEFFDRLISIAIPRIRDFRGLPPNSWDGRGNYTFGVNEQLIFPEIDYDRVSETRGMDITIVTSAQDNDGGRALLSAYGFPFASGVIDDVTLFNQRQRGGSRSGGKSAAKSRKGR